MRVMPTILWTRKELTALMKARDEAVAAGQNQFTFMGHPILVSYANYLIEYLDGVLE